MDVMVHELQLTRARAEQLMDRQRKVCFKFVYTVPCLCHRIGTLVPKAWHSSANSLTQLCQRLGTSKATVFFHIPVYTLSAQIGELHAHCPSRWRTRT